MGDMYTNPPQSRNEAILRATIDGTEYTDPPQSRIEDLLIQLKEAIEQGGGSVESYEQLTNKPQINGTTLSGDKSTEDLIPIDKGLEFDSDGKLAVSLGNGLAFNSDGEINNLTEANPSDSATGELSKLKVGSDIYSVVTKAVNDLTNYYTKSEVYTKDEVNNIAQARFAVVAQLPTQDIQTNVIYLVPKSTAQTNNDYDEYIYALKSTNPDTYGWEKIGDTEIDLSDYVTTQALNTALADYTTTTDLTTLLTGKADESDLDALETVVNGKADENEATPVSVSGNPITITDAANIPCESLSMTIEPIQSGSGTPSPENVRPIIGLTEANAGTGNGVSINLASPTSSKGELTFTVIGTTIAGKSVSAWNALKYNVSFTGNTTRRFKCHVKPITHNLKMRVFITNVNEQEPFPYDSGDIATETDLNVTFEAPAGTYELWLYGSRQTAWGDFVFGDIALYNDADVNTVTITFGETVYGGNVDYNKGKADSILGDVDISTLNWAYTSSGYFYVHHASSKVNGQMLCEALEATTAQNVKDHSVANSIAKDPTNGNLIAYYTESTDPTAFKTAMSGVKLVYEKATPTTLALTPAQLTLLKGYNTVSANGASISLDYQKDNLAGDIKKWVTSLESKVPQPPTTDGTYNLTVTVSSGEPTYSWESTT